jgi:hypothetical protein
MRKIAYLLASPFFYLLVFSCSQTKKLSKEFITNINKQTISFNNKIRFDGVYHQVTNSKAAGMYIYGAIIFFDNNATFSAGSYKSFEEFQVWQQMYNNDKKMMPYWGVYNIISDTIRSIILQPYPGGLLGGGKLYECHFQGIIKNRDSILQWHLVAPYPSVNMKAGENEWLINHAKESVDLYFKNVPTDKIIDPNKDWINKYRTRQ